MYEKLAILAAFTFCYTVLSGRIDKLPMSAPIVFAIMVINEKLPGSDFIATTVAFTVLLSLVVHGVSANPLAKWIAGKEGLTPS